MCACTCVCVQEREREREIARGGRKGWWVFYDCRFFKKGMTEVNKINFELENFRYDIEFAYSNNQTSRSGIVTVDLANGSPRSQPNLRTLTLLPYLSSYLTLGFKPN